MLRLLRGDRRGVRDWRFAGRDAAAAAAAKERSRKRSNGQTEVRSPEGEGENERANTGVLGSGGDWRDVDKAVASVGALDGGRGLERVEQTSCQCVSPPTTSRTGRLEKVEKAVAYHVQDLPRNSSNPEDLAMTLARGMAPALDELSEDASKTADDVVDFILNGRLPEEDDWPAKNRARMEEELREQEDERERDSGAGGGHGTAGDGGPLV